MSNAAIMAIVMAIDPEIEELIHFPEACKEFPGKKPCQQTLHRWRLRGVRGVKLETCIVGGLRYTSREAISRFIAAQNSPMATIPVSPARRAKQNADAKRELAGMGIR